MSLPEIVSADEWLAARVALLAREKELTRQRDALNADRRRLPMVRIDKDYAFEGERGPARLADLFDGARQLIVQHVMFDPAWDEACSACTASLDEVAPGLLDHLRSRQTAFAAVSRAPYPKLAGYRQRKGWTFPWYSSHGSDFNYDFHVSLDESVAPVNYNYRGRDELVAAGMDWLTGSPQEMPGLSCFLRDGDAVFHTYSTFGRGTEQVGGAYGFLDMTALGRQEEWEEPKGRADDPRQAIPNFAE
ncbi:MAG: DUF899 domain-containing protein [Mycobacteriales bacterium]|jgi:predicted dithiol-disulfide oxidoreductase (DUF899 family)